MRSQPKKRTRWHELLSAQHRVQVPILVINNRLWMRVSAQIYNELSDYEALAQALKPTDP